MALVFTGKNLKLYSSEADGQFQIRYSQATALTATVTGAMTGAFAVWLGHKK